MDANRINLLDFLMQTGPQYVIPVYQRNYTWKERNVKKLLDDIHNILIGDTKAHFLGNIIYIITSTRNLLQERAVVDGQQRLTTVFLILHAIRDIAYDCGDNYDAENIQLIYLSNNVSTGDKDSKKKLKPLVNDDDIYRKIADREFDDIKSSNSLIYKNYFMIKNELKSWAEEYSYGEITAAMNKVLIVWVQLDKDEDAQRIFESINTTGEPLKAFELIRNYILMNKNDEEQVRLYKDYWLKIEKYFKGSGNHIEPKDMEEFFRFYLASKLYILISKNDLYNSFKRYWNERVSKQSEEVILKDIVIYAKYYAILFLECRECDFLYEQIKILRKINSNMPTPFLMGILELFEHQKINKQQILSIFKIVNTYMIRRSIVSEQANSVSRIYPTLLKNVIVKCNDWGYEDIVDITKYYLCDANKQKSSYLPMDEQISTYLKTINAGVIDQVRTFFYVLETQNPIEINIEPLTVEHVLPQTSTPYWLNAMGGNDETYEKYFGRLGNLTLADKSTNSEMSNKDFDIKKRALERVGRINMSKDIYESPVWNCETIDKRTQTLIDKFLMLFPYFKAELDYDSITSYKIDFCHGDTIATALLYEDSSVLLQEGSVVRKSENRVKVLANMLDEFIDNGQIEENENDYILKDDIRFNAISTVTNFIYGGSNNGWEYWNDENGVVINESLRKLIKSK
ncbi:DUF4357 domain-containing protein [Chryseobacterium sp.]|uniref:DUF4357 domain-containing protein n=1 Tax=Chryseobacterium sp. TaxID=1871047 RepID=UPI002FC6E82D